MGWLSPLKIILPVSSDTAAHSPVSKQTPDAQSAPTRQTTSPESQLTLKTTPIRKNAAVQKFFMSQNIILRHFHVKGILLGLHCIATSP